MHVSGSQVRGLFRCHTSVHKWFAVEGEGGEIPLNLVNLALSVSFVHCYCGSNVLISWEECGVWDLEELEVFHTVQLTINVTLHSLCQSGISAVLFFFTYLPCFYSLLSCQQSLLDNVTLASPCILTWWLKLQIFVRHLRGY